MEEYLKNTGWIWSKKWRAEDNDSPLLMLFRKALEVEGNVSTAKIKISADTKYKLYVNGEFVEFGPSRGDKQIWFYDEVELAPFLKRGSNCIAVIVLRYPEDPLKGNHGMFRTSVPGLYVDGIIHMEDGSELRLVTDESWKCQREQGVSFEREEERFAPLIIHETAHGDPRLQGWKMPEYVPLFWENAACYTKSQVAESVSPGNLQQRTIPFLYKSEGRFQNVMSVRTSVHSREAWENFIQGKRELIIPAGREERIELDAGEEMTGFVYAAFEKGRGASVRLLYSEAYVQDGFEGPEQHPVKTDRTDVQNGHLDGYSDTYYLHGEGNEESAEIYTPFWFRTFRFVQVCIRTEKEPLILKRLDFKETGYPLQVISQVETSDSTHAPIWEISERTLRRCMHETYEDCPFYEQLQYIMDTRQQILYTYAVSADDRLARKSIEDMRRSQRYDGLLNCSYPNTNTNVIPGFSLYYILMVHDHMMYFGDKKLVRDCLPVIERILNYFEDHLTEDGLVGKIGGINEKAPFWSFIDWAKEWNDTMGMPTAGLYGPITMESLLYVYGLQKAADLYDYVGRDQEAKFLLDRAKNVQDSLLAHCVGARGMLTDGPGVEEYSQHCQVFAVLTGTGEPEVLKKNLLLSIRDEQIAQCSIAMRFYLFRALELTDLYACTDQYWEAWRVMLKNHCTTCVESEAYARSECHGWGALILYELPSVTLGVRPAAPGYGKISIQPVPGYLTHASGVVQTPKGPVKVSWELTGGEIALTYDAPDGVEIQL